MPGLRKYIYIRPRLCHPITEDAYILLQSKDITESPVLSDGLNQSPDNEVGEVVSLW